MLSDKQLLLKKYYQFCPHCQRQYQAIEPFKNYWDLPGGFVEVGESSIEACQRELKEEADIKIKVTNYVGSYPDCYQDYPTLVMGFVAKIEQGKIKAADDVSEFKWFPLDNLPKNIAFASINQIIKDYLSHSNLAKSEL
ncbi:MAG: NUDIX domain-containing protein [Patescibacteria group bacterium]|nr:NUDIX domain-containing protein [Patescibacteria group bacterium]